MPTDEPIVRVTRTLVYTGPEDWILHNIARAFVKLEQELGEGKTISSSWGEVEVVKSKGASPDGNGN